MKSLHPNLPVFKSIGPIRLAWFLMKHADKLLTSQCNVTYAQFKVLIIVSEQPSLTQKDLAQCLDSTQAAISRLVETLEEKNFIRRQPNSSNRRQNLLTMTPAGKQQLEHAVSLLQEMEQELYSKIPSGRLRTFEEVTQELIDLIEGVK